MTNHKLNYMITRLDYVLDFIQHEKERDNDVHKARSRRLSRIKTTLLDCQEDYRQFLDYKKKHDKIVDIVEDTIRSLNG